MSDEHLKRPVPGELRRWTTLCIDVVIGTYVMSDHTQWHADVVTTESQQLQRNMRSNSRWVKVCGP